MRFRPRLASSDGEDVGEKLLPIKKHLRPHSHDLTEGEMPMDVSIKVMTFNIIIAHQIQSIINSRQIASIILASLQLFSRQSILRILNSGSIRDAISADLPACPGGGVGIRLTKGAGSRLAVIIAVVTALAACLEGMEEPQPMSDLVDQDGPHISGGVGNEIGVVERIRWPAVGDSQGDELLRRQINPGVVLLVLVEVGENAVASERCPGDKTFADIDVQSSRVVEIVFAGESVEASHFTVRRAGRHRRLFVELEGVVESEGKARIHLLVHQVDDVHCSLEALLRWSSRRRGGVVTELDEVKDDGDADWMEAQRDLSLFHFGAQFEVAFGVPGCLPLVRNSAPTAMFLSFDYRADADKKE